MSPAHRPALDLGLYLVTDTRLCGAHGVADTVRAAVANGVTVVQLRDPDASGRELVELGDALREVLDGTGVPLIVNDRVDVALAVNADGVHVGQSDLPPERARALVGPDRYVGLSVHGAGQLAAAHRLPAGVVDYLGVAPVFAQATKPDADPPLGLDGLGALVGASRLPCVAIGGVKRQNAAAVRATGVAGIAVVSAICGRPDPGLAARELAEPDPVRVPEELS